MSKSFLWTWIVPEAVPEEVASAQTQPWERADKAILSALESGAGKSAHPVPSTTRSQLKRLFEENKIYLDDKPIKPNTKLKPGAKVQIEFAPPRPSELTPEDRPLEILFEDEHIVVVNKPQGLTVHPSSTQMEGTLVHALLHQIKNLSGIGGVLRPGIVHRLDKNTSGALVIGKTDVAHQRLVETFSKHAIERSYWAICYGAFTGPQKIESLIGRNPSDRKKMSMKVKRGRKAISYVKSLETYQNQNGTPFGSWLEVTLETGRTHQIRVHLTGSGHSIMGDALYGQPSSKHSKWLTLPDEIKQAVAELPGQALHARTLGFEHPVEKRYLRFCAEPPKQFQSLLRLLKEYCVRPL